MKRHGFLLFALFLWIANPADSQEPSVLDSLLQSLASAEEDSGKVQILTVITETYVQQAGYTDALPYAKEGYTLAKQLGYKAGEVHIADPLANCLLYLGDYDQALSLYLDLVAYWETKGQPALVAKYYFHIANIHKNQNNYDQALAFLQEALKYWKLQGDYAQAALTLWSISGVYADKCRTALSLGDTTNANLNYERTIRVIREALEIVEAEKDTASIAYYLNNLGYLCDKVNFCEEDQLLEQFGIIQSDFSEQAKEYLQKALALYEVKNDKPGTLGPIRSMGIFHSNRGLLLSKMGDKKKAAQNYLQAIEHFQYCLETLRELGFEHGVAFSNKDAGTVYLKLGNFAAAEKHLLQALDIFTRLGFRTGIIESYDLLTQLYEEKGDYRNALAYYKRYEAEQDSLANAETLKERERLIARYESDKKDRDIRLLQQEKALSQVRLERQRLRTWAFGTGLALIALISGAAILLLRSKRNREKAEMAQQLLEVKQEALKAQISDHFIANAMNSINRFIEQNDREEASRYLLRFSRLIRNILEISAEKGKHLIPLNEDLEIVGDYIGLEQLRYKNRSLQFQVHVDPSIDPESVLVPPMAVQILVENAVKHGLSDLSKGGRVEVNIQRQEDELHVFVEDDGVGRAATLLHAVKPGSSAHGAQLAKRLIFLFREMGEESHFRTEDLYDKNQQPSGTRVIFRIPYKTL